MGRETFEEAGLLLGAGEADEQAVDRVRKAVHEDADALVAVLIANHVVEHRWIRYIEPTTTWEVLKVSPGGGDPTAFTTHLRFPPWADDDADGMPDTWETKMGVNDANANDLSERYTNIEAFANRLAECPSLRLGLPNDASFAAGTTEVEIPFFGRWEMWADGQHLEVCIDGACKPYVDENSDSGHPVVLLALSRWAGRLARSSGGRIWNRLFWKSGPTIFDRGAMSGRFVSTKLLKNMGTKYRWCGGASCCDPSLRSVRSRSLRHTQNLGSDQARWSRRLRSIRGHSMLNPLLTACHLPSQARWQPSSGPRPTKSSITQR